MNTQENNKLIAEFMGFQKTNIGWYDSEEIMPPLSNTYDSNTFDEHELAFHTSWDWLMPVIHRIRDHVNVDMGFEEFDDWRENFKQIDPYNYSLEQCYEAVVEFIKQYNK